MKAFKFNLEPVQIVRRNDEQKALQLYAQALDERQSAFSQVRAAESALASERAEWRAQSLSGCRARLIAQSASGCEILGQQLQARVRVLNRAESLVQQRLSEVLRTRQRVEALENLEQRARREFQCATLKEEQTFMDELAQRRVPSTKSKPADHFIPSV